MKIITKKTSAKSLHVFDRMARRADTVSEMQARLTFRSIWSFDCLRHAPHGTITVVAQ
jgi:hypothetical protein